MATTKEAGMENCELLLAVLNGLPHAWQEIPGYGEVVDVIIHLHITHLPEAWRQNPEDNNVQAGPRRGDLCV